MARRSLVQPFFVPLVGASDGSGQPLVGRCAVLASWAVGWPSRRCYFFPVGPAPGPGPRAGPLGRETPARSV